MEANVNDRIRDAIESNRILIYMKGSPSFPMCGFSAATIEVFEQLGVPYQTVDVLKDPEVRGHQALLELADHPAGLRRGKVHRRLRHRPRDARGGRTRAARPGSARRLRTPGGLSSAMACAMPSESPRTERTAETTEGRR